MFLKLNHQNLDVYDASQVLVIECYKFCRNLPAEERFGMVSQIRRAALSVHLNVSEGASRKSLTERKRYYEIARGSIVELDAALDIACALNYNKKESIPDLGKAMIRCFQIISALLR